MAVQDAVTMLHSRLFELTLRLSGVSSVACFKTGRFLLVAVSYERAREETKRF